MKAQVAVFVVLSGIAPVAAQTTVVLPGDTLSAIAARELREAKRWPELCELNHDILGSNCDLLQPGSKLKLGEALETGLSQDDEPTTTATTTLPVQQLTPELLDVASRDEQYDEQPTYVLTSTGGVGQHRVAYLITLSSSKRVEVSWSFLPQDSVSIGVLLYSGSRNGTYGSVEIAGTENDLQVAATGGAEDASLTAEQNGWQTLAFQLDVAPEQSNTQVIVYPFGLGTDTANARALHSIAPVARALAQ